MSETPKINFDRLGKYTMAELTTFLSTMARDAKNLKDFRINREESVSPPADLGVMDRDLKSESVFYQELALSLQIEKLEAEIASRAEAAAETK